MNPIPFLDFGGDGPLLHFAHANAYPPGCYRQFLAPFLADYHVLAVRHRPLWPGSRPEELTGWQVITDDLIRFCEQENLRGVVGVGHSLGAVATMTAAVQRPELFRALALVEPVFLPPQILQLAAAYPEEAAKRPFVLRALNRRDRWESRQAAFDRFREKAVFDRWSDEALWDYVNYGTVEDGSGDVVLSYPREWEGRIYARPPQAVWEHLPQVRQPTLALRAAESDTIFPEAWQLWQAVQPDAAFVEMPDVGHMMPMERPLLVAETILNWLKELED